MKNLIRIILILFLVACGSSINTKSNYKLPERLQTTPTVGWLNMGSFITPDDKIKRSKIKEIEFHKGEPYLLVEHVEKADNDNDANRHNTLLKHDGTSWKKVSNYIKDGSYEWVSNLKSNGDKLYRLLHWKYLQHLENEKWVNSNKDKGFSPAYPKQSYSYQPFLSFDNNKKPMVVWHDGEYLAPGKKSGADWMSASWNKTGKWEWMGKRAVRRYTGNRQMYVNTKNVPYMVFKDYDPEIYIQNHYLLSMMKLVKNKWEYVGKRGFNPNSIEGVDFEFKMLGDIPYVFFKHTPDWASVKRYNERKYYHTVMKFENNEWLALPNVPGRSVSNDYDLVFSSKGEPIVSLIDNYHFIKVYKFNGTIWEQLGKLGTEPHKNTLANGVRVQAYLLANLFMDIDENDRIVVAFKQTTTLRNSTTRKDTRIIDFKSYSYELN